MGVSVDPPNDQPLQTPYFGRKKISITYSILSKRYIHRQEIGVAQSPPFYAPKKIAGAHGCSLEAKSWSAIQTPSWFNPKALGGDPVQSQIQKAVYIRLGCSMPLRSLKRGTFEKHGSPEFGEFHVTTEQHLPMIREKWLNEG